MDHSPICLRAKLRRGRKIRPLRRTTTQYVYGWIEAAGSPDSWSINGSAAENSSLSPGCVCVLVIVPVASSITECAERHADKREGGTLLRVFLTRFLRSRYTRSIGNCMPNVWTASHGSIHKPSSADKWSRPNRPFRRFAPWSATSTLPARTAWRVRFDIFSRRSGVVRRPRIVPPLARRRIHCAIPVIVAVHHSMVLVSWPLQKLKSYRSSVVAQSSCFERASRPACWEQQPR
jgi:hypothetical protein